MAKCIHNTLLCQITQNVMKEDVMKSIMISVAQLVSDSDGEVVTPTVHKSAQILLRLAISLCNEVTATVV